MKIASISLPCKIDTLSLNIGHDYVIRHDFEKDGVYDSGPCILFDDFTKIFYRVLIHAVEYTVLF